MTRSLSLAALLCATPAVAQTPASVDAGALPKGAEVLATGLVRPWSMAWLSGGDVVITERPGRMRLFSGETLSAPISGLPEMFTPTSLAENPQGLQDVAVGPEDRLFYCYHFKSAGAKIAHVRVATARLDRARLALTNTVVLFDAIDSGAPSDRNPGACRIALRGDELIVTVGDISRFSKIAQDDRRPLGKVFALVRDQLGNYTAVAKTFAKGIRDAEGLTLDDQGQLWETEHGPMGGDELNILQSGGNYGWPIQTYGLEYSGAKIGEPIVSGVRQPIYYWDPSIAPSGLAFCTTPAGDRRLYVGALKFQEIAALNVLDNRVMHENAVAMGDRIRDVRCHDGWLYVLTDSDHGRLIRMRPFQ